MAYDISYEYDGCGNRVKKVNNLTGETTTYTYDAANQLTTEQTGGATKTYTYDQAGNLLSSSAGDTNTWDDENRRTRAELPGPVVTTMKYNGDGLRVQKDDPTGATKFIWDGQNYLLETDSANVTTTRYTNQPRQYGNLISQRRGAGVGASTEYFHFCSATTTFPL